MKDNPLTKCPECSKRTLRRLIGTGAGIIFKGAGFYQTDYKQGSASKSPPTGSNGTQKESSSGSTNSEKSCGTCGKTGPNVCD